MKNNLFEAVVKHYEAEIARHRATLDLYLNDPVAIADHSTIVEEIFGLVNKLSSAEDSLATLNRYSDNTKAL